MQFRNLFYLIFLIIPYLAFSEAQVQVIHNSSDVLAGSVDVYVNGSLPSELDDFSFRDATPFLTLPSGADINISVNDPTSTDVNDQVIGTFNLGQLEDNTSYVIIANGVVGDGYTNPDDANRSIAFDLYPIAGSQGASDNMNVALNVFHGATDAPAVDVYADINGQPLIPNLDYGNATGYTELPASDYELTITAAGNKDVVAGTFSAPLSALGGGAGVVFASGFLTTDDEAQGVGAEQAFGLFAALPDGTVLELPAVEQEDGMAMVQVIHNAAAPAASEVDVYVGGQLLDALDNFAFRSATPFVELPAGQEITISVNAATSSDVNDQVVGTFTVGPLEADAEYVVIANGIVGDGYTNPDEANRNIAFDLYPIAGSQGASDNMSVALNVFHGATDAPAVDVYADINGQPLIPNLDYGNATGYTELPAADYNLTITAAGNKEVVAGEFEADLSTLGGGAAVVFASGFLTIEDESDGVTSEQSFGLFAALPDGTVLDLQPTSDVIIDKKESRLMNVYPNPASSSVTIDLSEITSEVTDYQIYDLQGNLIKSEKISNNSQLNINTDVFSVGTYVIRVRNIFNKILINKFTIAR